MNDQFEGDFGLDDTGLRKDTVMATRDEKTGICQSGFRGQRETKFSVTSTGEVSSFTQVPSVPGSPQHFIDVLESSLKKSMVLEDVLRHLEQYGNGDMPLLAERITQILEEILEAGYFHDEDEERVQALSEAAEALGLTPPQATTLMARAMAFDRLLRQVFFKRVPLEHRWNVVRTEVREAKRGVADQFRELVRAHIDAIIDDAP